MNTNTILGALAGVTILGVPVVAVVNAIQDMSPAVKTAAVATGGAVGLAGGTYLVKKTRE